MNQNTITKMFPLPQGSHPQQGKMFTSPQGSNPNSGENDAIGSSGLQGASSTKNDGGAGVFQSGNGSNTMAVLRLISAMMKLYNDKNNQFEKQTNMESTVAICFSDSQVQLGEQELSEQEFQGAFAIFGGVMSGFLLGKQIGDESGLGGQQKELDESQKFVNDIDPDPDVGFTENPKLGPPGSEHEMQDMSEIAVPKELTPQEQADREDMAKARVEKMITDIKSGTYKMYDGEGKSAIAKKAYTIKSKDCELTDHDVIKTLAKSDSQSGELTRLKAAAKDHIDGLQAKYKAESDRLAGLLNKRQMGSQAISGVSTGVGQIGAGQYKAEQAQTNADNTLYSSAQQGFQKLAQQTESQSNTDLQTIASLTSLIQDIDKSNNAILSA